MLELKVLIAEDEPASRLLAKRLVSKLGHQVVLAEDGHEALQILKEDSTIGVLITDCYMPKLDGFELAAAVQSNDKLNHIACVLASADNRLRHRARDARFFAWIKKPLKAENIAPILSHHFVQNLKMAAAPSTASAGNTGSTGNASSTPTTEMSAKP